MAEETERVLSSLELGITERDVSADEMAALLADGEDIGWINVGGSSKPEPIKPWEDSFTQPVDEALAAAKLQWPSIIRQAAKHGWVSRGKVPGLVAQASNAVVPFRGNDQSKGAAIAKSTGQTSSSWTDSGWGTSSGSRQLTIEDLFTTLDFVPLPANVRLEVYEQTMFQENHLIALCVQRVASGSTKRGWEYARYEDDLTDENADQADAAEIESLTQWYDNINTVSNLRQITEHIAASFVTCSNSYIEIIREEPHDYKSLPAGVEPAISSSMRVIRGHRGFIQWLAGRFVWFNPYMPHVEDRAAGTKIYEDYWRSKGVDPSSQEFMDSPWSRTISSSMPEGVFNPHLTEMIHLKDLSLSSKYYGFPNDYRLGKLHAMLQWALDYNVSLLKNNRIPPFVLVYHGQLSAAAQQDIQEYFNSLKGAANYGKVPIIQAPPGSGSPQKGGATTGLEIAKIGEPDKDGLFGDLITLIRKETAAHYGIPIDLLTTENSNRSTIEIAEMLFNDHVVNRLHTILEEMWKQVTKYDLGYEKRFLRYINLDTDDELAKAQVAEIWHNIGAENPNEQRAKYLGRPERPGGDEYFEASSASFQAEDLSSEEAASTKAKELAKDPAKLAAFIRSQDAAAAAQKPGVTQSEDPWEYLLREYGD